MILTYLQLNWEDKHYDTEKIDDWGKDYDSLGLDFPNLPYIIDGEFKLTESFAI